MVELTWEIADGVIFYLRPISELKNTIEKMQNKKKIDVSCQLITCVSKDSQKAIDHAKKTLSFYISVGEIYRNFLAKNGFQNETEEIFQEFEKSGLGHVDEFVSDSMIESLTICGNPQECLTKLKKFKDTGLDLPILQFNPIDDVKESFSLLTSTFSEVTE
jgi:alkanesulfonate monooxygenase SsuD/methylene tetrahydromethanopterin reductase-like flavin-dependent oxidoreductase (luciferase family)